jgi:hypothetical protein
MLFIRLSFGRSPSRRSKRYAPGCDAPSRPLGARLVLVGHGLRERQIRGPARAGGSPELRVISVRKSFAEQRS